MKRTILGLGSWTFLAAALVWGQEPADPPSRVARLSFVEGPVSFQPASVEDWVEATLNYPLTTGDRLWTAENSYAEVRIGATAIQLAPQAAFTMSYLDDSVAQMSLAQGTAYVRIPALREGEAVEVDTPNGALSLLQTGSYRVDVDVENNVTSVTVRSGEVDVTGNGRIFKVLPGRTLQLVADQEVADIRDAAEPDDWEQACVARYQQAEQSLEASESYVPLEMDGAEDLAQYGEWSTDASFGAVWCPVGLAADWAPYRNGHWAFIPPWGWTWIDDAPWGFAPFHFGRWGFLDGRWVWVPGRRDLRPVYSPALVAFLDGRGTRSSLPARTGPVAAWIPLGPGEAYRPPYPASDGYLRRVNGPAVRDTSSAGSGPAIYRNRGQMVVVPRETLTGAQPVTGAVIRVPRNAGGAEPVSIADVQPTRQSYLGRQANPQIKVATPPAAAVSRTVIVKHEIPRAVNPAVASTPVPPTVSAPPRESVRPALPQVNMARPAADPIERQADRPRPEPRPQSPPPQSPLPKSIEQPRVDQQRVEQQRAEQQRAELQRAVQQRAEQQRVEQQHAEQQRAEQQRAEQQRAEQHRAEQQRAEQQRAEQQRAEQQRAEQQRAEQQRAEQQRAEQQRAEQQRAEQQRAEQQRAEQQRAEQQRAEQQRAEQQRAEQQRAEQQRAEQQRAEQQRAEQQRAEQQRAEQQRAEQQRAEQQRAEQQRAEQQRAEQQRAEEQRKAEEAKKHQ